MISILVLFLLGVASSKHISYYDNDSSLQPSISQSQERRICAELCMSGLGGEPCGDDCLDVIPQGLPTKSQSQSSQHSVDYTRQDACPLLCANQLGYPLCGCNYTQSIQPFFKVDYLQICSHFCVKYSYQIYGCSDCQTYKNMSEEQPTITGIAGKIAKKNVYDWNAWCVQMCQEGEGGSACYCDLLPMSIKL